MSLLDGDDAGVRHTRIKLCGFTRAEDVDAAVALGVDAIGFVFYERSPRHVTASQAARLVERLPAGIDAVGLFVDAAVDHVRAVAQAVPLTLVQLHGDERPADAGASRVPWIKAARVSDTLDLLDFATAFREASLLLLDADAPGYGGSGRRFDWSRVPAAWAHGGGRRFALSGGLDAGNVGAAIDALGPHAVDVSSGIERAKGVKDVDAMHAFVAAVRAADARRHRLSIRPSTTADDPIPARTRARHA